MTSEKFRFIRKTENEYCLFSNDQKFVLLAFDENYLCQAINLMMSVTKFNKGVSFICLCEELSEEGRKELFSAFSAPVGIILYEYKMLFSFPSIRWVPTTIYRVFSPYLIEKRIKKVLYLDADMVCTGNLDMLFNIRDYTICMATEISANSSTQEHRTGIQQSLNDAFVYCNAGTVLINLEKIRELYTFNQIFDSFFENVDQLRFLDQDFLNWFFNKNITRINGLIYDFQPYELKGSAYYNALLSNAKIIHFTSGKPWDRDCDLWLMKIYLKYSVYEKMIKLVKNEMKRHVQMLPVKKLLALFK